MSQIIPLGIGSPATIPELVLTGLSPATLPPSPVPGSSALNLQILNPGDIGYSFNAFTSIIFTNGAEFSLLSRTVEITWQVIFGSVPAIASIALQSSLNGINWITIDSTTNVNGDLKNIKSSAKFIRASILDMSEGISTTVILVIKPTQMWES